MVTYIWAVLYNIFSFLSQGLLTKTKAKNLILTLSMCINQIWILLFNESKNGQFPESCVLLHVGSQKVHLRESLVIHIFIAIIVVLLQWSCRAFRMCPHF